MIEERDGLKILDCKADDNVYLHKDFHGALCYGIKYLDDHFGPEATAEYLRQVGRSYYSLLTKDLQRDGLPALEMHWNQVFTQEGGKFEMKYEDGTLVLSVHECPAVAHLKKNGQLFTNRYCETTVVVNDTICREAGYAASCAYEPGAGRCIQKFWKPKE